MYDAYPNIIRKPVLQINIGNEDLDVLNLKSTLESVLTCIKSCSKKRKRQASCANPETSHYTNCGTFVQKIISIQNVVAGALGITGNECVKLSGGQVSISDFIIATNEMLAYIEALSSTCFDESADEKFLSHLGSLRRSLNKTPRNFMQL